EIDTTLRPKDSRGIYRRTMAERPLELAMGCTVALVPGGPARPGLLRPGTTVAGTYQILRLLGQGGMGAVWEATHLRLPDKRVVVKVLLFGTTDRQKPPLWIQGKKQLTLTVVPIES